MCSTTIYASTCIVLALTSGECLGEASSLATYPSNAYHSVCVHNMSYIHKHTIMVDFTLQESWFPLGIRLLDVVALLPSTFLARVVECTSTMLAPLYQQQYLDGMLFHMPYVWQLSIGFTGYHKLFGQHLGMNVTTTKCVIE